MVTEGSHDMFVSFSLQREDKKEKKKDSVLFTVFFLHTRLIFFPFFLI